MAAPRFIPEDRLEQLPIFPLVDVHLFPGTLLPLHIFEPRYVELLQDALAGDRALAMAAIDSDLAREGDPNPPVHPVLGAGIIVAARPTGDGRWNIILKGTDRLRLVEELPVDTPYRQVRAERLIETPAPLDHPAYERLRQMVAGLAMQAPDAEKALTLLLSQASSPSALTDLLGAHATSDAQVRQRLLSCVDVAERLELCCDAVGRLLLEVADGPGETRYAN
ncbi:MAG: LON peptidase substrate-binding domain-containing protein [Myxococcales bacterium]|nr:LON peptidase substrate-binding domain-containing protein [Myxococcales bacterium]